MLLREYLYTKALEEATEEAVAFSKAANFGLDHIDEKEKKPQRAVIGAEINDILVFIDLLKEEGVTISPIANPANIEMWQDRFAKELFEAYGSDAKDMTEKDLQRALLILGASRASLLVKAFTKTLTFGIDSVDPATGISNRDKIATMFDAVIVVIRMLIEEGVEIPGIGDREYIQRRYEKAVAGAAGAHQAGLIVDDSFTVSKEEIENGGVEQTVSDPLDTVVPGVIDQETGNQPGDLDNLVSFLYGAPTAGDAAPAAVTTVEQ